jgi:hypothetical protein
MYGPSGTLQNLDGLCVLPINVLNEKARPARLDDDELFGSQNSRLLYCVRPEKATYKQATYLNK